MKNVLVIDDDKNVVKLINDCLNMLNLSVDFAFDGKEGLEKFKGGNFDLVITDINLPGRRGNEIAEQIRILNPETILFGISGEYWELRKNHFDAVFQKPFPLIPFMRKIQEFLPDSIVN